ncbi:MULTISPECIES: hypothetical protein [unclassified Microbacterium]|uniref:hypothetical protein n=1 Tax=unclassified Microbacterium TaxID=2609290 RepID=UPI003C2B227B
MTSTLSERFKIARPWLIAGALIVISFGLGLAAQSYTPELVYYEPRPNGHSIYRYESTPAWPGALQLLSGLLGAVGVIWLFILFVRWRMRRNPDGWI